jgi:hypothetical protein
MAYGQFTGYEEAPEVGPGALRFQLANGKSMLATDQAAADLKARIDAADSVNKVAMAPTGPGVAPVKSDAGGAPFKVSGFAGKLREQGLAQNAADLASLGTAGEPPPQQQAAQGPGGQLGYGLSVNERGEIVQRKFVPGTKAVTKEDIQQAEADKTAVKQGQSEVVQQGMPEDQQYLEELGEQTLDRRLQLQTQMDQERLALEEESALAQERFNATQRLQAEQLARQADLEKKMANEEALHNKAVEDHASSKVNPNRIFANPVAGILGAFAAGAGAYAAAINKSPNFAQEAISQAIDRDIRAQEAQIKLKGEKADNLLGRLQRTGMSLGQARAAAEEIQLRYHQQKLQTARARNAVPALESYYANQDTALVAGLSEARARSRAAAADKVTRSTQSGFASPRAATAGRVVETPVKDQLGTAKDLQGLRAGELANRKAEAALAGGGPSSPELRKTDQALAGLASDQERLEQYGDEAKPLTPENRNIIARKSMAATDELFGQGTWAEWFYDDKDRDFIQDFEGAKSNLIAGISVANEQGAMQEGERKEAERRIAAAGTVGELKRAQSWVRNKLERKREAAKANPGPTTEITK